MPIVNKKNIIIFLIILLMYLIIKIYSHNYKKMKYKNITYLIITHDINFFLKLMLHMPLIKIIII